MLEKQAKEIIILTRKSDFCFFPSFIPFFQKSDLML